MQCPVQATLYAQATARKLRWELDKENGQASPEPKWPVLWVDDEKVVAFKPYFDYEDEYRTWMPEFKSRPDMLAELAGEKFAQYTHTTEILQQ